MDFKTFIQEQLKIAKINAEHREAFTDPEGLQLFLTAVTHPTYNAEDNYQELEFIGDGIIKGILSQYIPRRFPNITKRTKKSTGEGVLSKTRRYLEQRKTLSDFALKRGFWDYVRADDDTKAKLRKETLEDVFEAFVGALVEIVDNRVKRGLGYNYAYNYVSASLDDLKIDISSQTLDDPITRLNELYKANELKDGKLLKWGDAAYKTVQVHVPKLSVAPRNGSPGDVYFSIEDKQPYIYDGANWVHASNMQLLPVKPFPHEVEYDAEGKPTNVQSLWYAGVYGFPNLLGKPATILDKVRPKEVLDNPQRYGAVIIGQGLQFKKVDAKKTAASKALELLNNEGYRK